jgi:hypothetical protein
MDKVVSRGCTAFQNFHINVGRVALERNVINPGKVMLPSGCMYEEWAIRSGPCTATFNDLLCFPF